MKIRCSSCEQSYTVKPELMGRTFRCKKCEAPVEVPHDTEPDFSDVEERLPARRRSRKRRASKTPSIPGEAVAFKKWLNQVFTSDRIEPVTVSWAYRLSIALVTLLMIMIPVIYFGLIILVGFGTWLAAAAVMDVVGTAVGTIVTVFLVLAALCVVLFLLKPLFSRPENTGGQRVLSPEDEPNVFAFVHHICDVVNGPYPRQIVIDCNINAAAGLEHGLLSLFSGNMKLVLGMSLVAGLSVQQFAGVLAHEFGHFSQGTGMRVSLIIRVISMWMTRVVYERDIWDVRLEQAREKAGGMAFLLLPVRFGL